jgi:hypothetical protein
MNLLDKAELEGKQAMALAKKLGVPKIMASSANILSKIYKKKINHKLALENFELFVKMNDSTNN